MKVFSKNYLKCLLAVAVYCAAVVNVHAKIVVADPHARTTFAMAETGVVYMTLTNHDDAEDVLTKVEVSAETAREAQLHTTFTERDMVRMRQLEEGIKLPPHQDVRLLPGGHHLMLVGLKRPLTEDTRIPLTLHFANADPVKVEARVKRVEDEQDHPHDHH